MFRRNLNTATRSHGSEDRCKTLQCQDMAVPVHQAVKKWGSGVEVRGGRNVLTSALDGDDHYYRCSCSVSQNTAFKCWPGRACLVY
jgi:hypothetical protein